jgi:hypothetical protein
MLPEFDQQGFLPEGVWTCGLVEFVKTFAVFRRSDRRLMLYEKLESLLKETLATGWVQEIIIDGSFVTKKDEPGDIDIILALFPAFDTAEISFWTGKVLDGKFLSKKYSFDVKVETFGSFGYQKTLDFFQQIKDSDERKGVVRLTQ